MKNINFSDEIKNFLKYLNSKGYSESTINSYYFGLKDFVNYLGNSNNSDIGSINNETVNNFKNYLLNKNNSAQTINTKLFAVQKFINRIETNLKIDLNVKINILKQKNKKDIIYISSADFDNIINKINKNDDIISKRNRLFFSLLYYTGSRTKDLLKTKKKDVRGNILIIGGNEIAINNNVGSGIKNYLESSYFVNLNNEAYLFFSFAGRKFNFSFPLTEKSIQDFFKKYFRSLNENLSIIDLRNSYFKNLHNFQLNIEINKINNPKIIKSDIDYLNL